MTEMLYTSHMVNLTSPTDFLCAFTAAREENDLIREMTSPFSPSEGRSCYLTSDRLSGFCLKEGEITHLFSLVSGRGRMLVGEAIAHGGERLDCFDGYLPKLYGQFGFKVYAREKNWTPGGPDVVYMSLS